jgi:hypothetical protein
VSTALAEKVIMHAREFTLRAIAYNQRSRNKGQWQLQS